MTEKLINKNITELPIELLETGTIQPRKFFNDEKLAELAASLKAKGVLQPIIVRPKDDKYEVLVGERRKRAASLAGFKTIPVVIKETDDKEALEIALTENLQREDLNPLEEAWAILKLMKEYDYTVNKMSKELGKSDTFIQWRLALLKLPEPVQGLVLQGDLPMESAASLLKLESSDEQIKMAGEMVEKTLTTHEAIDAVKKAMTDGSVSAAASGTGKKRNEMNGGGNKSAIERIDCKKLIGQLESLLNELKYLDMEKVSLPQRESLKGLLFGLEEVISGTLKRIEFAD